MSQSDPAISQYGFTTGIRRLDLALEGELERGKYLLFCAQQGGGKTILATQLAGHAVQAGKNVLLISTEVAAAAVLNRMASSFCNFDCNHPARILDGIEFEEFDDPDILIPNIEIYGPKFATCFFNELRLQLKEHYSFRKIESLTYKPLQLLRRILSDYMKQKQQAPDILILDYIWPPNDNIPQDAKVWDSRAAVLAASGAMKEMAREFNLLSVAFCQATVTAEGDIDSGCIANYGRALAEPADAFIGLSMRGATPDEPSRGIYALSQTMCVEIHGGATVKLPVNTNYRFQRCEDPTGDEGGLEERPAKGQIKPGNIEAVTAVLRKAKGFPGYVLMSRQRFEQLLDLGNPNCVNVYILLLLAGNFRDKGRLGTSFWSRKSIAEKLGSSVKVIRGATDRLEKEGLITAHNEDRDVCRGRSLQYVLHDWEEDQDWKKATNYFKLFRNLLCDRMKGVTGNPEMLRLWVYFLCRARGRDDEETQLKRGSFILDHQEIQERFEITAQKTDGLIESLVNENRIIKSLGFDDNVELSLKNWILYQDLVHAALAKGEPHRCPQSKTKRKDFDRQETALRAMADRENAEFKEREEEREKAARANQGQNEGKWRADSGQTKGSSGQTPGN